MKNIIILLLIMISMLSAVELKGYTLGDTCTTELIQANTLAGIPGAIFLETLNDNRIHSMGFMPSSDLTSLDRINQSDVTRLVNGLNAKYDINLRFYPKQYSRNSGFYKATKDNIVYLISVDYNQFMTPAYQITIYISDTALLNISNAEKQSEANLDF